MTKHDQSFIESLLKLKGSAVRDNQQALFQQFIQEEQILKAVQVIIKTQTDIVESWKERSMIDDILQKHIMLPNGRVNKAYNFTFDPVASGLTEMGDFEWQIPAELGIAFDEATNTIAGTPKQQGEFILSLLFRLKDHPADKPFSEKKIHLVINPDPKSLWQNLPSDQQDKYWQPDSAAVTLPFGNRKLVIASKRGRSHAHEGKFRDDSFGCDFNTEKGWGIIAVADGAGSAKYSRKGADIACKAAVNSFQELLTGDKIAGLEDAINTYLTDPSEDSQKKVSMQFIEQLGKLAFTAQGKIKQEAQENGAEPKDYATTLIFALVKQYPAGYVISSFWVGDGGIGIYQDATGEAFVMGTPDSGEFAGQTRFLTMSDIFANGAYVNRIRFKVVPDFTALLLMTDGLTDPKFQTDANLQKSEIWRQLWQDLNGANEDGTKVNFAGSPEEVKECLLSWLDFWSPGNHDDRTIAILY
ncbi:PP2C family serine/threonine-protein phosphatase [Chitinophaga rhizophila]|uniref:Protein phosphatase 2C domain-containing protein n=1 Tax=Chitinophaga rhizophila TaxID=2866212 RepID=A0ABS7GFQ4_9BACT|nr:PP2C family serine/threonine-protein phosphatase [Chitinophaga rhizophila]MBW8686523.1 protein phosphatase 2C domain-containing protein [Chitinophaga rhizophila]